MGKYKNEKVDYNGSFLVKSTGAIDYQGSSSGDNNQIATYDPEFGALASTDLQSLIEQFEYFFCVSQYENSEPDDRPDGDDLERGDLWTDEGSKFMYVWSGSDWIQLKAPGTNPVGTIIQNMQPPTSPPSGYLYCDGSNCPPQYGELFALLDDGELPNLQTGAAPYSYIKF